MITDEKRAFKRVRRKFTVRYRPHAASVSSGGISASRNISLGGVYFISLEKLEVGQLLDCWIKMPGIPQEGRWTARVVRCENAGDKMIDTFGIAVEFVKPFGNSGKDLEKALDIPG